MSSREVNSTSSSGGSNPIPTSSSSNNNGSMSNSNNGISVVMVLKTLAICSIFMLVGPSLIMVNQHILKNGFPYPMFLSGLGVLATGFAARILIFFGKYLHSSLQSPICSHTLALFLLQVMTNSNGQNRLKVGYGSNVSFPSVSPQLLH